MSLVRPPFGPPSVSVASFSNGGLTQQSINDHNYEYVLQCVSNCDNSVLAASVSTNSTKLYDKETMSVMRELSGHTGTINDTTFVAGDPSLLLTSSSDRTARLWDVRTGSIVKAFNANSDVWSSSVGCGGNLLAMGGDGTVVFVDLRRGKRVGEYNESNSDDVTQVRFHPGSQSHLVAGSEDGLICVFDTSQATEEEAVISVMNAESAVAKLGFFGPQGEGMYCVTGTETLSLWDVNSAQRMGDFQNIREQITSHYANPSVATEAIRAGSSGAFGSTMQVASNPDIGASLRADYLVDCRFDATTNELLLLAGNHDGNLHVLDVKPDAVRPVSVLVGGHKAGVRAIEWEGRSLITAGEDGRVCVWRGPQDGAAGGTVPVTTLERMEASRPAKARKQKKKGVRASPY